MSAAAYAVALPSPLAWFAAIGAGASARPAAATFEDAAAAASPPDEAEEEDGDRTGLMIAVGAGALALGGGYLLHRRRRS